LSLGRPLRCDLPNTPDKFQVVEAPTLAIVDAQNPFATKSAHRYRASRIHVRNAPKADKPAPT
jgi:hypothetical protein